MRFEMHDIDMVNAKQLLKLNIVKGATNVFGAKESMGKGQVDLRAVCVSKPGEAITQWFPLGAEDWSNDDGPVRAPSLYQLADALQANIPDFGLRERIGLHLISSSSRCRAGTAASSS